MDDSWLLAGMVLLDTVTLTVCAAVLFARGRLAFSHPAIAYFFFHAFVVTFRSWNILAGQPTLFSDWPGRRYDGVSIDEICHAILVFDAALVLMTLGWLRAAADDLAAESTRRAAAAPIYRLWPPHVWRVAAVTFPIGLAFLVLLRGVGTDSGAGGGGWEQSTWLVLPKAWAGLSLVCLIYCYGFRPWLTVPMGLYLAVMALQGSHRFRVIIPVIMLVMIYLDRHRLRWPRLPMLALLLALGVLFFPLKQIGRAVRDGTSFTTLLETSQESLAAVQSGAQGDANLLDTVAATLTLVDETGYFYGKTYLAILVNPIPRVLWPGKPGLADWLDDISTPGRPLALCGMTTSLLGESYANFGYLGLLLIPLGFAYASGRFYFSAYRSPYDSVRRFTYLIVACNLIQVYRDGLISLVVFPLIQMVPMVAVVALHLVVPYLRMPRGLLKNSAPASPFAPLPLHARPAHGAAEQSGARP